MTHLTPRSAVILAGGRSSRMGTDKARLQLGTTTLLERVTHVASTVFQQILVIAADTAQCADMDLGDALIVQDEPQFRGRGPLAGIYTGLLNCSGETACFLTCDMPFVDAALLRHIAERSATDSDVTCFRNDAGHHEPFPGVFQRRLLEVIGTLLAQEKLSLCRFLDQVRTRYLEVPHGSELMFTNTNTPHEYQSALSRHTQL